MRGSGHPLRRSGDDLGVTPITKAPITSVSTLGAGVALGLTARRVAGVRGVGIGTTGGRVLVPGTVATEGLVLALGSVSRRVGQMAATGYLGETLFTQVARDIISPSSRKLPN